MEKYEPPFTINNRMLEIVSSIMENLGEISIFSSLDKQPRLRKINHVKSIHSSCAIEANSLSFDNVTSIINGKKVIGKESEIIEIKNIHEAYNRIDSYNPLKEEDLILAHDLIMNNLDDNKGYRTHNEGVVDEKGNTIHIAPPPNMVPSLMNNLFTWLKQKDGKINPLILSSIFHYEFVFIHPFGNGNGRTVRLWQTVILGKWKEIFKYLPIENEIYKHQADYYDAINKSNIEGSSNIFVEFMLDMIDKSIKELKKDIHTLDKSTNIYMRRLKEQIPPNRFFTSKEILEMLNLKSKENLRKNYIDPGISIGLIEVEYPDKPTSRNQRYLIKKGRR